MALTVNGLRTGRAGASDLADIREYIQIEQEAEAKRRRAEVKERTEKLIRDIASMMFDDEYKAWLGNTPNDNEGFLQACEAKYIELTTQSHPVDQAQQVEQEIDETLFRTVAESDGRNPAENNQIKGYFGKVKVTTSADWRKRHLNGEASA